MDKKVIKIVINNREITRFENPKDLPGIISEIFEPHLQFSSQQALKERLIVIRQMLIEIEKVLKIPCTRVIHGMDYMIDNDMPREKLISFFYEMILRSHNEGTLPGFGYVRFEKTENNTLRTLSRFMVNPEKTSLRELNKVEL